MLTTQTQHTYPYPHIIDTARHASLSPEGRTLVLGWPTSDILVGSQSPFWSQIVLCSVPTSLIATTYPIVDHVLDRLLGRDCLSDRGSRGVAHTLLIAIGYRGPHHTDRDHLPDQRSESRSPP